MDELEQRLKRFINQVSEMIFNLLCSLDIGQMQKQSGKAINIMQMALIFFSSLLNPQIHVPAHTPTFIIFLHVRIHPEQGSFLWAQTNVE